MKKMEKISLRGRELLRNPSKNKGTAFTDQEREMYGLNGLLPERVSTIEEQVKRRYDNFRAKSARLDKYTFLADLHNRNETLFFRLVKDHIVEMLPYIYTPVVGDASIEFSLLYNQSRGVYLSYKHKDQLEQILSDLKTDDVQVIVVTDGGRVLGLGDVGIGGMVIPIGKTALYTLFAGIAPGKTLPIFLDVGCNTESILKSNHYIGSAHKRIEGEQYYEFLDRFIAAVKKVYPNALLQWEDFSREHAGPLLEKYRNQICSFNDDIQGTASVALSAVIAALRMKGETIHNQKIAIFGAGSAGMGIATILVQYMKLCGITDSEAHRKIFLIDREGLIHDGLSNIRPEHRPFAHHIKGGGDRFVSLEDAVKEGGITTLIGVSAQKGAFTQAVIKNMLQYTSRPIVFPLSNPNSKSEITPEDLYHWSNAQAIMATGSPFDPVSHNGHSHTIEQCNNVYIFPSIGLASVALGMQRIPDEMFVVAAEALSKKTHNSLFPPITQLKDITTSVATTLGEYAIKHNLAKAPTGKTVREAIESVVWEPKYEVLQAL